MFLFKLGSYLHVLVYCSFCTEDLLLPKRNYKLEVLERCIEQIQNLYFKPKDVTIVLNASKSFEKLKLTSKPIINYSNYSKELLFFKLMKADAYIITLSVEIADELLKSLTLQSQWNPRAKFVIVILEDNIEKMMNIFKKYYIFNVIILKMLSDEKIEIYTYFPYNSTFENGRSQVLVNKCNNGELEKDVDLFPEKLPESWKDIAVRVALIKYPPYVLYNNCETVDFCGIEVDVFKLIQKIMGFRIKYVITPYTNWGHKEPNNSYVGGSIGLQNYDFDVGLGAYFPNSSEVWDFDISYPYVKDSTNWVVPTSREKIRITNRAFLFDLTVWFLIILCSFIAFLFLYLFAPSQCEAECYQSLTGCFFICFQCLLSQAVYILPKTTRLRIILILWVFLSYIVVSVYQSWLTSSLGYFTYSKQITNVQELIDSKLEFGFYTDSAFQFSCPEDKIDSYIYKHFRPCTRDSGCTNRTAYQGDFATIKVKRYLEYMTFKYFIGKDKLPLVYILKEKVRNVILAMAFVKGFPMLDKINRILIRLETYGFMNYFYNSDRYYNRMIFKNPSDINLGVPINFSEYEKTMFLMISGWIAATITFVIECIVHFIKSKTMIKQNKSFSLTF